MNRNALHSDKPQRPSEQSIAPNKGDCFSEVDALDVHLTKADAAAGAFSAARLKIALDAWVAEHVPAFCDDDLHGHRAN